MVYLTDIQTSNSQIATTFPPGLVAVFVGGTSGIGEITLKKFAEYTRYPRAYIVGRSQNAAERIIAECRILNPEGEYIFIKADVSLMRNVDKVCDEIKSKEKAVNLLFMSAGFPSIDGAGQKTFLTLFPKKPILTQTTRNFRRISLALSIDDIFSRPLRPESATHYQNSFLTPSHHHSRRRWSRRANIS